MTDHEPTIETVAADLRFANEVETFWHGYGEPDTTDPDRPFIPVEVYGDEGEIVARYRLWVELERLDSAQ